MSCHAAVAAGHINAYCTLKWPAGSNERYPKNEAAGMASTLANGGVIDAYDHEGGGSHKYIPADRLTAELGEPEHGGVYGYWRMKDGSYLLLTCRGPLAWWTGKVEDRAKWGDHSGVEMPVAEVVA
jgi:hypothetical protein